MAIVDVVYVPGTNGVATTPLAAMFDTVYNIMRSLNGTTQPIERVQFDTEVHNFYITTHVNGEKLRIQMDMTDLVMVQIDNVLTRNLFKQYYKQFN